MNELVKIETNEKQEVVISGRELHNFLEIGTQYSKWFDRMKEYGFVENQDFQAISQKRITAQNNETTYTDHALTLDMAKEISMIQRNVKGKEARQYFIQVEKEHNQKKNSLTRKQELALKVFAGGVEGLEASVELANIEKEEVRKLERNGNNKIISGGQVVEMLGINGLTSTILNNWMVDKGLGIWVKFFGDKNRTFQPTENYMEYVSGIGYSLTGTTNKGKIRMIYTTLFVDRINELHLANLIQFTKCYNGEIIQEAI